MPGIGAKVVFDAGELDHLIAVLRQQGMLVLGPKVEDAAVIYAPLDSAADLPTGWTDRCEAGTYRLSRAADNSPASFGYTLGVQGWKRALYPPRQKLFHAERAGSGFRVLREHDPAQPMAFLGVRGCELAAIRVQDAVFDSHGFAEPGYLGRRRQSLIIAVECSHAAETCFCASAGAGPAVGTGVDIVLNEIVEDGAARYVAEARSERGLAVLAHLTVRPATTDEIDTARHQPQQAARQQTRGLDPDAAGVLARNLENPRWAQVAQRCLTCANCTMVCPTCYCTTVEDVTDLSGNHAERWRRWDSCFTIDYSYIHGGSVRNETASRYRQWITHKLSTWHSQFGASGCVGCGRCIAWCPVGIDITEEVRVLRETEQGR